jgi:hypothetical protein
MFMSFRQAVAAARRQKDLCFASLLSQETILGAFGAGAKKGAEKVSGCQEPLIGSTLHPPEKASDLG